MAAPVGATMRGCGRCPEYSEFFRHICLTSDAQTDFGRMGIRSCPGRVGHVQSSPPDSGIGLSLDGRTQGSGVGRFYQSTFRQSISQTPRRKRRVASRMMTDSDMGLDLMPEGTQRGTPRKRALFGPVCSHSVSPVSDVAEARTG